jgi:RHS repeat-associated protein
MLDAFGLINMNGRVYDPIVARFLSPDNYVQLPNNSQGFNRYSYCLNNPLVYTDPSGEFLTWSIGNGGFSIGFNLTPIGIPLGAGINIKWGDGASAGVYSEVGYRVGGTGFGSGATVSQGLDYNIKHNSWSTTTSAGAYASFGPVNAGANISETFDITANQWSTGWGINAGVGFGNDARGIGFNIGYGSTGFTYGMGGYHNSKAWDSNPDYEPASWNDNGQIQNSNNCYSYALDDPNNPIGGKPQPGEYSGNTFTNLTLDDITNAAVRDGYIKKPNFFNKMGFGKRGYYEVYLVIDNVDGVQDYHWYRQDKGGLWSQKHGSGYVTNVDGSSHLISNPAIANHNYGVYPGYGTLNYSNGGIFLWKKR